MNSHPPSSPLSILTPPSLSEHSIKHKLPHVDTSVQERKTAGRCCFACLLLITVYGKGTRRVHLAWTPATTKMQQITHLYTTALCSWQNKIRLPSLLIAFAHTKERTHKPTTAPSLACLIISPTAWQLTQDPGQSSLVMTRKLSVFRD